MAEGVVLNTIQSEFESQDRYKCRAGGNGIRSYLKSSFIEVRIFGTAHYFCGEMDITSGFEPEVTGSTPVRNTQG